MKKEELKNYLREHNLILEGSVDIMETSHKDHFLVYGSIKKEIESHFSIISSCNAYETIYSSVIIKTNERKKSAKKLKLKNSDIKESVQTQKNINEKQAENVLTQIKDGLLVIWSFLKYGFFFPSLIGLIGIPVLLLMGVITASLPTAIIMVFCLVLVLDMFYSIFEGKPMD